MAIYEIPKNLGRVRVVMALGGVYAVWNGKDKKLKFEILCRSRAQAYEVAKKINSGDHDGTIDVMTK